MGTKGEIQREQKDEGKERERERGEEGKGEKSKGEELKKKIERGSMIQ